MTDAPDLLPCPFCAVYPSYEVAAFSTRHRISCEDCEFEMQKPTREEAQRAWNTRDHPMTVAEAAKVLLDNTPNPTFDILKYPMIGEFKQSIAMQDEDGEEVWRDVTIEWTTIKEIFTAGLRALSQGGE